MSRFVLALDQGTTSCRAILFDHDGAIVAVAQQEFPQHFPQPGWVEHDAEEIWATQAATMRRGARARPRDRRRRRRHRHHQPARDHGAVGPRHAASRSARAIVWQDRRTAERCARAARATATSRRCARAPACCSIPYFSGTKLAWLLDHVPGARAARRARRARLRHDRHLARLEADRRRACTSPTRRNASRTLLFDIADRRLGRRAARAARHPARAAAARSCHRRRVSARRDRAVRRARFPIAGIAGDQQAALFGQACFEPGMAKNTYGTGCFVLMNTGAEPVRLAQPAADDGGLAARRPAHLRARGQRVHRRRGRAVAARRPRAHRAGRPRSRRSRPPVPDTGGVYLVPGVHRPRRPHWDPHARGTIVGLTRGTTAATSPAPRSRRSRSRRATAAGDAAGRAATAARAARRRRRDRQRPADAVPGRRARRAGRAPAGHRDDGARRRLPRRARRRLLGIGSRVAAKLEAGPPLRAGDAARSRRPPPAVFGAGPSNARATGTSRTEDPALGKTIALATPVFFALIALEFAIGRARGRSNYRLNDALNSLSLGVMSQVAGLFTRLLAFGIYAAVYAAFSIWQLPADQWWDLGARDRGVRFLLLLEPPAGPRERDLLGVARGSPPEPGVQPLDGAAPDDLGRAAGLDLLPADGNRRVTAAGVHRRRDRRPAVPVLDPHRAGRQARLVRPLVRVAVESPRAPRGQRSLPRPQLRRHLHGLGPDVRPVRRGGREMRVRHARAARVLGPAVGQPRGLRRPRAQVVARSPLA